MLFYHFPLFINAFDDRLKLLDFCIAACTGGGKFVLGFPLYLSKKIKELLNGGGVGQVLFHLLSRNIGKGGTLHIG